MSKLVSFMMGGGLILAAIAAINFKSVDARQQADFIQISVLAQSQANYGMDENVMSIPVVSLAILEDKVHDARENPAVPVILYTSLPVPEKEESSEDPEDEPQDPLVDIQHGNGHLHENNGNDDSNPPNAGNGNQGEGQENGNNGKNDGNNGKNDDDNGKDKGKDKDK